METGLESEWLKCDPFPQNTCDIEGERAFIQIAFRVLYYRHSHRYL